MKTNTNRRQNGTLKAARVRDLPVDVANATTVKAGAFNGFANFGDIKGEVVDTGHKDRTEALSWHWGV